jgi:hypothetical protein
MFRLLLDTETFREFLFYLNLQIASKVAMETPGILNKKFWYFSTHLIFYLKTSSDEPETHQKENFIPVFFIRWFSDSSVIFPKCFPGNIFVELR